MDNDSLKLIARLKVGAARLGQSIDLARLATDAEYAKTVILRFTDFSDDRGVALALDLIDRLGLNASPATAAGSRGPMFRRVLRPIHPATMAPAVTLSRLDLHLSERPR